MKFIMDTKYKVTSRSKSRKISEKLKKLSLSLLFFLVILVAFIWIENNLLQTSNFTFSSFEIPTEFNGMRILQLTDLHSKSFGKDNKRLISKIDKLNPDIIVITGDMMNASNDDGMVFLQLAQELTHKYPVFYTLGNHEETIEERSKVKNFDWFSDYIKKLENLGVNVLYNDGVELIKGKQHINLYGLVLPLSYYNAHNSSHKGKDQYPQNDFFQMKMDEFNILLAHTPFYFQEYSNWGADLILSGHNHGGIINIQFIREVLSTILDFFPKYCSGEYINNTSTMIVGRGLGNSSINMRIFNRPELVIIELKNDME